MEKTVNQTNDKLKVFFGGKCDFKTAPFYVFVVLSAIGICATSVSADLSVSSKTKLLLIQSSYLLLGSLIIGYLSAHCHKGWAWFALLPIACLPIY